MSDYKTRYEGLFEDSEVHMLCVADGDILLTDESMGDLTDPEIPGVTPAELEQRAEEIGFLENVMYENLREETQELADSMGGRLQIRCRDQDWIGGVPVYEAYILVPA